jgi:hypothetical protein
MSSGVALRAFSHIGRHVRTFTVLLAIAVVVNPTVLGAQESDIQVQRPRIDVTAFDDLTTTLEGPLALEAAERIGPGFPTKARVGLGGGSDKDFWLGDFAGAFGDSGSALVSCVPAGTGFSGRGAIGVLTHLGLSVCPCDVRFKNFKIKAQHGVIFGTTVARAVEMAKEAGLSLKVFLP